MCPQIIHVHAAIQQQQQQHRAMMEAFRPCLAANPSETKSASAPRSSNGPLEDLVIPHLTSPSPPDAARRLQRLIAGVAGCGLSASHAGVKPSPQITIGAARPSRDYGVRFDPWSPRFMSLPLCLV
ncbi:hypothetical protein XANCAGTX0491_003249 [Xanthoria calcicola]